MTTDRAIYRRSRFFRTIADALPGMVAYWDANLRCRFANHAYVEWFGRTPESMVGTSIQDLMGPDLFARNEPYIRAALRGEPQQFERTLIKANGTTGHTLAHYVPDVDPEGGVAGFFVLVTEVTRLKEAEVKARLAATVFQNAVEGILVTDVNQVILSVNPAFTSITGYSAEEAIGRTPRILKSNQHDQAFYASMWQDITSKGRWQGEIWNRRKGGEAYLEWLTITKVAGGDGRPEHYLSVFNDITEFRRNDERNKFLAFHDALTGLPNRTLLVDRLEHQITKATRERENIAVLFLDLDRFKVVNDTLGHDVGDELLRKVAEKLLAQVRVTDTVARLGGDEFVVLLENPKDLAFVGLLAERIIKVINEPMELKGNLVQVGVSIGISLFPGDGETMEALMRGADQAMYEGKRRGRNDYRFVEPRS